MIALGIETSCDETSAAIVQDGRFVLSNVTASSLKLHQKYKGIIPEIASRAHIEYISLVVSRALNKAAKKIADIDIICVTRGPGLVGSLLVGISFAKGLSYSAGKPMVGVNHLQAHLYASFLAYGPAQRRPRAKRPTLPFIGLVVSGGHTSLFFVGHNFQFNQISSTIDDAAGEAFDKVAKVLDLGYPGGPVIERIARKGKAENARFSCRGPGELDFSFSGIKTAVLYKIQSINRQPKPETRNPKPADIAAGFQKAVADVLVEKSLTACSKKKVNTLVVGGGVAANNFLRGRFESEAKLKNINVYFPPLGLTLDNAAMIAGLGCRLFRQGIKSDYYLSADPAL